MICMIRGRSFACYGACTIENEIKAYKKVKRVSYAMHLPLTRLVSMPVIFCLLPSASMVILVFYLFSADQ